MNFLSHHLLSQCALPGVNGTNGLICGHTGSDQALIINGGGGAMKASLMWMSPIILTLRQRSFSEACVRKSQSLGH